MPSSQVAPAAAGSRACRARIPPPADRSPSSSRGRAGRRRLPADDQVFYRADETGWGSRVMAEFAEWIQRAADADSWLRHHPPTIEWVVGEVPPAEVAADGPIVEALLGTQRDLDRPARLGGLDNWHDGAALVVEAGIPAVCFGPGDIQQAHGVDECVPVADLVACAQGIAVTAIRFCAVAGTERSEKT